MTTYISANLPEKLSLRLTSEAVHETQPKRAFIFTGIVTEYEEEINPYSGVLADQYGELEFFVPKEKIQRAQEFEDLLFFSLAHDLPITFSGEYSLENSIYTLTSYQNPFLSSDSLLEIKKPLQVGFKAKGVEYFKSDDGLRGLLYDEVGEVPFFISQNKFNEENLASIIWDFMCLQQDSDSIIKVYGQRKPGAAYDISSVYTRLGNGELDYQPRL